MSYKFPSYIIFTILTNTEYVEVESLVNSFVHELVR